MDGGRLDPATQRELRELVPRLVAAVARRSGDFSAAEDAVQEALLAAAADWPERGVPRNPGGWLFHVACRRLSDQLDAERARKRREALVLVDGCEPERAPEPDEPLLADGDDTLALFFTCCHPALTSDSAIALTLRAVGGLTTAEVASAFFVPEATMAQRISRAKQTVRASDVPLVLPRDAADRARRIDAVLHVLYLMFNEGYVGTSGPRLARVELSDEAIRLARLVRNLAPEHAEAAGLLALMLLTDARRTARTGPGGELIPLHEQDRGKWDRAAIAEGTALVTAALARGTVGSYQLQAAIASLHDEAASIDATDWPQILALYGLLRRMSDNPMVELSRAVALAMVNGPAAGLAELDGIDRDGRLSSGHRLDAVRAHLHELAGDPAAAIRHYLAAAARAENAAERQYLVRKAERLGQR